MIRRGTLSGHFVEHLEGLMRRWAQAVETLPDSYLIEQRNNLRAQCDANAAKPETLVLQILEAEARRRRGVAR